VLHRHLINKLRIYGIQGQAYRLKPSLLAVSNLCCVMESAQNILLSHPEFLEVQFWVLYCFCFTLLTASVVDPRIQPSVCLPMMQYRVIHSIEDHVALQCDLVSLEQYWAKSWGMVFDVSKCHTVHTSRSSSSQQYMYQLSGVILSSSSVASIMVTPHWPGDGWGNTEAGIY